MKMDISTLLGVGVGIGAILLGNALEHLPGVGDDLLQRSRLVGIEAFCEDREELVEIALRSDGMDDGNHMGIIPSDPARHPAA